jgi:hypothetical protein
MKNKRNFQKEHTMPLRRSSDVFGDPGISELENRIPQSLFKYSGLSGERLEWMRKLIVDSELYFTPPSKFNDPLDCRISPRFDASSLVIQQFWRHYAKQHSPGRKMRSHKKWIDKVMKDSKTPSGQKKLREMFFENLHQNGVACFAKNPFSMLLWSYYAEGHRGIAIRFDGTLKHLGAISPDLFPVEVQYATKFPEINFYKASTFKFLATMLGTKADAWKHEEEWRLVLVGITGYVRIPREMINGIILGMRTDPKSEDTLRRWIDGRSPAVELLRVANRTNSFELELIPA